MTRVFIGGSRKITVLPLPVINRLDNIINQGFAVLIGDANGADKCVQKYLADKGYRRVTVFCMGETCRNNLGNWETRNITAEKTAKGSDFYAIKDRAMADEASCGLMIWDAKSNGTLNNVMNLIQQRKKVLVYFSPDQSFHTVRDGRDLSDLLAKCDRQNVVRFEKKLAITQRLSQIQPELEWA
jgi:hypothetical protein